MMISIRILDIIGIMFVRLINHFFFFQLITLLRCSAWTWIGVDVRLPARPCWHHLGKSRALAHTASFQMDGVQKSAPCWALLTQGEWGKGRQGAPFPIASFCCVGAWCRGGGSVPPVGLYDLTGNILPYFC